MAASETGVPRYPQLIVLLRRIMMNITNTGLRGFPFHYFKQAIVRWPQSSMVSAFQPPEK